MPRMLSKLIISLFVKQKTPLVEQILTRLEREIFTYSKLKNLNELNEFIRKKINSMNFFERFIIECALGCSLNELTKKTNDYTAGVTIAYYKNKENAYMHNPLIFNMFHKKLPGITNLGVDSHIFENYTEGVAVPGVLFFNKETNKEKRKKNKQKKEKVFLPVSEIEKMFTDFWECYPSGKGKKKAFERYLKIMQRNANALELHLKMLSAIEQQGKERELRLAWELWCPDWKLAATWLNQECWNDNVNLSMEHVEDECRRTKKSFEYFRIKNKNNPEQSEYTSLDLLFEDI